MKNGERKLLTDAINFACMAHEGQVRKGTKVPYCVHLMETLSIVSRLTTQQEVLAASVLHDILEDTDISKDELLESFSEWVVELVVSETTYKRKGENPRETWKSRKQETIDRMYRCKAIETKIIALGDKYSNLKFLYDEYRIHQEKVWDRFNQENPQEIGWYYREIANATSELKDTHVWQEYDQLIKIMFETEKGE